MKITRGLGVSPVRAAARKKLRKQAEKQKLSDLVPDTWLDPLLSGPNSPLRNKQGGTWGCPEIEALLNGIRARIRAAEQPHQASGTEP
jgi:hypothetical protein